MGDRGIRAEAAEYEAGRGSKWKTCICGGWWVIFAIVLRLGALKRWKCALFFPPNFYACLSGLRSHLAIFVFQLPQNVSPLCPCLDISVELLTRCVYGIWNTVIFCPYYLPLMSNQLLYIPDASLNSHCSSFGFPISELQRHLLRFLLTSLVRKKQKEKERS